MLNFILGLAVTYDDSFCYRDDPRKRRECGCGIEKFRKIDVGSRSRRYVETDDPFYSYIEM